MTPRPSALFAIAALLAVSGVVHAADAQLSDQQKRMQVCNTEAKTKTFKDADERRTFMSACLKG